MQSESGSWTGAGWYFSASHYDNVRKETHGHTYEVKAWFPAGRDAVVLQETLKGVLRAFDHKTLPPELSRAEDLAKAIGGLMGDCVGVDIERPAERLGAKWRI
jgi:6-pyruvoyl-tetrahydropterin synthase